MAIILDLSNPLFTFRDVEAMLHVDEYDHSHPLTDQPAHINGIQFVPCHYRVSREMQDTNYDTTFRGYWIRCPKPYAASLQMAAMSDPGKSIVYHCESGDTYFIAPANTAKMLMGFAKCLDKSPKAVVFPTADTPPIPLWTNKIRDAQGR